MYGVELAISNNINQGLGREGVRERLLAVKNRAR